MDMNAPETDIGKKTAQLTDRDLHCIARLLQSEYAEDSVQCLYCKYAFQCRKMFLETHEVPYLAVLEKLKGITGVNVHLVNPGSIQKNILDASWIENCPDLLEKFTSISFEEQQGILKSPDILRYKDSYNVEM